MITKVSVEALRQLVRGTPCDKLLDLVPLRITSSPAWRRLTSDGLVRARISVETPSWMDSDAPVVTLDSGQRDRYLVLSAHGRGATVQVIPPYMSIAYQSSETTTRSSVRAQQLYTEDVITELGVIAGGFGFLLVSASLGKGAAARSPMPGRPGRLRTGGGPDSYKKGCSSEHR
jgi:hypothetical protein